MRGGVVQKPVNEGEYARRSRNGRLNRLFWRWAWQYGGRASDFHRDGIVDEAQFRKAKPRVLFVLLEPNSKGGRKPKNPGSDLRALWHDVPLKKSLDRNLARWTRLLLDGARRFPRKLTPDQTRDELRRVAIINLKKLAGGGKANEEAIGILAWQDRAHLRKQIRIIRPNVVVACGPRANKLLTWILHDDLHCPVEEKRPWTAKGLRVLPGNHPAVRPRNALDAFRRLSKMARLAKIGSRRA